MNTKQIEEKWQKIWEQGKYFEASNTSDKESYYILVEFPYPSGAGLHVGHVRSYTALDAMARLKRAQGFNVLFPMGWDAFGAPAEQYAIKNKIHPSQAVKENVKTFKGQMQTLGFSFDWTREFSTTDPEYYKWTQWQFLQFVKAGMAYKGEAEINWCPNCKTGLSNEDAAGGVCERCGTTTTKKLKSQWMLKMKDYAESLLSGLDDTEFLDRIKTAQINWIGKSIGANVNFKLKDQDDYLEVFTTRADTLYGVTFMVMSPEHKYLEKYASSINNMDVIKEYQKEARQKSEIERTDMTKEKTGILIDGLTAINPLNNKEVPIYISDYVLTNYGTGAIMAVPAHDERDFAFATKYNIDIIPVIDNKTNPLPYIGDGLHINSDIINGLGKQEAIDKVINFLEENKIGSKTTNYKLQDWVFSRQRFWGEPIPMINCEHCGWVPVPETDLPVVLPNVENYEPTETGESPLANIEEWVNTTCPCCKAPAKRETDTMPNWAGSSWYYLRYMDPNNDKEFVSQEAMKYWGMVDYYNGGMEHATRHLLYARFWHQFLYNQGLVPYNEPFKKRVAHGMILGSNNEKMSKSKGNVVNPDDMVKEYGADALRLYEMFIGDYTMDAAWSENGLKGCRRFLDRIVKLRDKLNSSEEITPSTEIILNQTIKKVTEDVLTMKYNTAVSSLMILLNKFDEQETISRKDYRIILNLLNPMAPHITEEINENLNLGTMFAQTPWPTYDENKITFEEKEIGVQVNGKVRSSIIININDDEETIKQKALSDEKIINNLEGKEIVKIIVIKGKIINIVVKG